MGALVLVLVAIFALSESDQIKLGDTASTEEIVFASTDEGDINQIFDTTSYRFEPTIHVVVEKPVVQAQFHCYRSTELVRDLTVPYGQRSYIQADGSTCTPVQ